MFPLCLPKIASLSLDPMFTNSMICHNAFNAVFWQLIFSSLPKNIFNGGTSLVPLD